MKRKFKFLAAAVAVAAVVTFGAAALAAAGDSNDPLVTLSYLTNVFTPQVETKVNEAVAANEAALKSELDAAIEEWDKLVSGQSAQGGSSSAFTVVTLSKGQQLVGSVGCEVMLRVGTAVCVSDSAPGLIDCTKGATLNNGSALVKNHLYMVTIETRAVKATADTVKVLARGNYTIV